MGVVQASHLLVNVELIAYLFVVKAPDFPADNELTSPGVGELPRFESREPLVHVWATVDTLTVFADYIQKEEWVTRDKGKISSYEYWWERH